MKWNECEHVRKCVEIYIMYVYFKDNWNAFRFCF